MKKTLKAAAPSVFCLLCGNDFQPVAVRVGLVPEGRRYTEDTKELLSLIDVLVDGPYVAELYDITLKFKGSSNQRVIDCRKYNEKGVIEELM